MSNHPKAARTAGVTADAVPSTGIGMSHGMSHTVNHGVSHPKAARREPATTDAVPSPNREDRHA